MTRASPAPGPAAPAPFETIVATLVATDLVGSTALVSSLGDERAAALFRRHDEVVRALLREHRGTELERTDGFVCLFRRPIDATRFCLGLHDALDALGKEVGHELRARAGIHMGECVMTPVVGGSKQVEAEGLTRVVSVRVMSLANGGQTLLTRAAFDMARRAAVGNDSVPAEARWLAHGAYYFKGIGETVEVFEVGLPGPGRLARPADSNKARRAVPAGEEDVLGWRPAPSLEIPGRKNWFLSDKLGEGGFGEVWLAQHAKTHDRRVFKFCFDPHRLRSLKREVTLFRLLRESLGDRDDIARILDWQFDEAPFFLESEYTEGGNLAQWMKARLQEKGAPLRQRLALVAQAAHALDAAHRAGVLHKDIKPSNILVARGPGGAPQARLTDFGIGMLSDERILAEAQITATGMTTMGATSTTSGAGTRMYLAPEVLEGKPASVKSDLYALGVILFQMVCGDVTRALAPGWERLVPDSYLRQYIARCCDHDPEARFESAAELASALDGLEAHARAVEKREVLLETLRYGAISGVCAIASVVGLGLLLFIPDGSDWIGELWFVAKFVTLGLFLVGVGVRRFIYADIESAVFRRLERRSHLTGEARNAARAAAARYYAAAVGFPLGIGLWAYTVGRPRLARAAWSADFEKLGDGPLPRWCWAGATTVGGFALLELAGFLYAMLGLGWIEHVRAPEGFPLLWMLVLPVMPGALMLLYFGARALFARAARRSWERLFPGALALATGAAVLCWAPLSVVLDLDSRFFRDHDGSVVLRALREAPRYEGHIGKPLSAQVLREDERKALPASTKVRVLCLVPDDVQLTEPALRDYSGRSAPIPLRRLGRNSHGAIWEAVLDYAPVRFDFVHSPVDAPPAPEPGLTAPRDLQGDPLLLRTDEDDIVYLAQWGVPPS